MKSSYEKYYEDSYNVCRRDMIDYEFAGGDGEVDLDYYLETGNIKEQQVETVKTLIDYEARDENGTVIIEKFNRQGIKCETGYKYNTEKKQVERILGNFEELIKGAKVVKGETYPVKDIIKDAGFIWDGSNKAWIKIQDTKINLPKLKGSKKQIAWAEDIRKKAITTLNNVNKIKKTEIEKAIKEYDKAKWWIENRNEDFIWLLGLVGC